MKKNLSQHPTVNLAYQLLSLRSSVDPPSVRFPAFFNKLTRPDWRHFRTT